MADSLIRWKRKDYMKLYHAVKKFNKRVNELEASQYNYLPKLRNYEELRDSIMSRKQLNRTITSLRNFSKEGMNKKVELPSGQIVTKWQYHEIKINRNRAVENLREEARNIIEGDVYSKEGMGNKRLKEINRAIERYKGIETQKGSQFLGTEYSLLRAGRSDIDLVKLEQFRQNFMNALEEMSTYDNFRKLKRELRNIKDPRDFYEYVRQSPELMDLFLYYKDKATAQTYGGFASNQDAFNAGLEKLGILV